jgi:adenylate cyclase
MPCPACGASTQRGARFCHRCGRRLDAPGGWKAGDRRVVTALFADLVGYTRLVAELDPEEVRAHVDRALGLLGQSVVKFEGTLEKFVGDAVLAVFGAPKAHDDDALRACLCAVEMQEALGRLGAEGDRPLALRVGVATGEVVAAVRDLAGISSVALTGECMTTAARLQQLAVPGEILLDEATVRAAEPRIVADLVGRQLLRGQSQPVTVHRLERVRRQAPSVSRRAALVGRDRERAKLAELIGRTAQTGRGGAALVRGEPGIGKSRLLLEMEDEARRAGFGWVWVDHPPHRAGSPYYSVRSLIEVLADELGQAAGVVARQTFGSGMDEETARLLFGASVVMARDLGLELLPEEGWDPRFQGLADPSELAAGVKLAIRRFLAGLTAERPRCFVFDDYHWMDPSSQSLLTEMIRLSSEMPYVVLTAARPPAAPDWISRPNVEVLELAGLDEAATECLGSIVGGAELEPGSASWLYDRTAGNALFIGEIMKALRAGNRLALVGDRLRIDRAAAQRSVPLSLRALLGARIDALGPSPRECLEVASVAGVEFGTALLRDLRGGTDVSGDLRQLAEAGIVVRCEDEPDEAQALAETRDPDCWRFKHQLWHDAAYGRLLADRRQALHAALADRLEARTPPVDAAELARHRIAAGDAERALPLLERAAQEAEALGAIAEAEAFRLAAAELGAQRRPSPAV